MSTTDKLAQLVQTFLVRYSPKDDPAPYAAKGLPQDLDDLAQQARDALAEHKASQSIPADAVEVASDAYAELALEGVDMTAMQAALAAAFPVLVQQVEDMKESVHHWRRQYNIECENLTKVEAERDTLSAENARLREANETLMAVLTLNDAATAQAKQSPEKSHD